MIEKFFINLFVLICVPGLVLLFLFEPDKLKSRMENGWVEWFRYILPHVIIFWVLLILGFCLL